MKHRSELKDLALKGLGNLVSVKATVFIVASVFLCAEKINQVTWLQVIGIVIGARTANELVSMVKKGKE
jgi:uncharacterized transporter YbjL